MTVIPGAIVVLGCMQHTANVDPVHLATKWQHLDAIILSIIRTSIVEREVLFRAGADTASTT